MVHIHSNAGEKHRVHHYVNSDASAMALSRQTVEGGQGGVECLTDIHTEELSSSRAEIRTHANDSADTDKL